MSELLENKKHEHQVTQWIDYSVLHTGNGCKLEQWGEAVLLRPDPQAIWDSAIDMLAFKGLNMSYNRNNNGGGEWTTHAKTAEEWTVSCKINGVRFKWIVKPMGFKHTGLFPEQIKNWEIMTDLLGDYYHHNGDKCAKVLNLFGYTGAASVVCATYSAKVCHVDAAKNMVDRCKQNATLNKIPSDSIRYIVDDCFKFIKREQKRGNFYDAIIMDPPSYGRGPNGELWRLEDNIFQFVKECAKLLSDKPVFFLINSYTTGLQPTVLANLLKVCLPNGKINAYEVGLPTQDRDIVLPCGCSGLWQPV